MNAFGKADELVDHLKEYIHNHISLLKLQAAAKTSKVIATLVAAGLLAGLLLFFMMFVGIAAALVISKWIGEWYVGFAVVSGLYLILSFVIWNSKEKLIRIPLMKKILEQLFAGEKDQEHTQP
jgi:hypothetical protein